MEYNEILYYKPTERPELVRIISESLRLDVTIIPKDQGNESYYASLVELAKCPEIDHIYAWDGPIYCEGDDNGEFCELRGQMVDICRCLDFFLSTEEHEKGLQMGREQLLAFERDREGIAKKKENLLSDEEGCSEEPDAGGEEN